MRLLDVPFCRHRRSLMKRLLALVLAITFAGPLLAATKSVTLSVRGWSCGGCAAKTRIALKKLEGVEEVLTDHEKKEAVIRYDDTKVGPERLIEVIEETGYPATVKGAPAVSTEPARPPKGVSSAASSNA